jgi:hypothetical protein
MGGLYKKYHLIKIINKMKTNKLLRSPKNIFLGLLASMILFSFSSNAQKIEFLNSSIVPAAKGNVKVNTDKNNNYVIKVSVTNLAEVTRLEPSRETYVLWMVTNEDKTENVGQLISSSGILSKGMKASFKTVSSSKPIKIYITAENDGNITIPEGEVVLTTDNF